jgi:two-component system, sensor histidine kinase PdtaS
MTAEPGNTSAVLLRNVALGMALTADLSRSDLLLVRPLNAHQLSVVAQAQPRSISPLHDEDCTGQALTRREAPLLFDAWRRRHRVQEQLNLPSGAPVMQDVRPVLDAEGTLAGLLSIETSLIQVERHRHRPRSFRRVVDWVKGMCARGEMADSAALSRFEEMDGILLVDSQLRITYLSGIANNLYRRLGFMHDLRGTKLSQLHTADAEMALTAMQTRQPMERETSEDGRVWIRKALPVWAPPNAVGWVQHRLVNGGLQRTFIDRVSAGEVGSVLLMVHDATEERRKRLELEVKSTMIQEVHHRVKNNLQNIAALLRMQARRTEDVGTQQAIKEAISRILSVAVIHEFLSLDESQSINIRDVCQRIVAQTRQVVAPDQQIDMTIEGPVIYLPSQQATACALVVNELVQNALEHGFETKQEGQIQVVLIDRGDAVQLEVHDDGDPLPDAFTLGASTSLGLQIVQSLVQSDLRGEVRLENREQSVVATVHFPKMVVSGAGTPR